MKKNILLLINGFGIEQPDSHNIYSKELMPNLDRLTKEQLFTTLKSNDLDYKEGYRTFSIGVQEPLTYTIVENAINDLSYKENPVFKSIITNTQSKNSKLHIMCFYENSKTINQLLSYLKEFISSNITIYIHLIFCQKSIHAYKDMGNLLTRLNYEYETAKIGVVAGLSRFETLNPIREFQKSLLTEYGENWKDLSKKVEVLTQTRTIPTNARSFIVSNGYKLANNDQILFFNYNNIDITSFITELKNQKYVPSLDINSINYYSLFPLKSTEEIPYINNYAYSSIHALNSLKSINAKCVIFDMKDKCSYINYYMTGLRNTIDENLKYVMIDDGSIYDKDKIIKIINSYPQELLIFNYEIDTSKDLTFMEKRLSLIDEIIGLIEQLVLKNNWGLFISSLYGMEKELLNDKKISYKINFSKKVPLIIVDKSLPKSTTVLGEGTVYDLSNTILKNINNEYKTEGLIKQKPKLFSFLYKKSKGEKQ